jgi:hypothetical protein
MKFNNHLKSINHFTSKIINYLKTFKYNHGYLMLFIIICVAIFVFSKITNKREGFSEEKNDDKLDIEEVDYNSSYTAPAGNTVLFNKPKKEHKHTKYCNHKKVRNYDDDDDSNIGVPRNQIPDGDEDLYILKSQVVPPVCPACPNVTACPNNNNNNNKPPPCPPCARCPEPAFDCKKVPNYNSNDSEYLPRPVLADFSQFGM